MLKGYEGWMVAGIKKAFDFNTTVEISDSDEGNSNTKE